MKAEYNGVTFEGTPAEVAEVIKLVGAMKETTITYIQDANRPWQPYIYPWWTDRVWCSGGDSVDVTQYGGGTITWNCQ